MSLSLFRVIPDSCITFGLHINVPQGTLFRLTAIHLVPQRTLSRLTAIHLVPQRTLSRLTAIHLVKTGTYYAIQTISGYSPIVRSCVKL